MSDLWKVEVLNRGRTWIDVEVHQVHPDAGFFPEQAAYALALLLHEAYSIDASYQKVPNGALGRAIPFDESYKMNALKLRAPHFIRSVLVYRAVNLPFDEAAMGAKIVAQGIARDSDEFAKAVSGFFGADYAQPKWLAFWSDRGHPRAIYRIEVTDRAWIEHLPPGKRFTSAAFGDSDEYVDQDRDLGPGTPPDAEGPPPQPAPPATSGPTQPARNWSLPNVTFSTGRAAPPKPGIPTWAKVLGALVLLPVLGLGSCLACASLATDGQASAAASAPKSPPPRLATTARSNAAKK